MTEPLDTQVRGHHPDSPSSLQSSEACPCFENEQRESAASTKGTLQHKATETGDLSMLNGDEAMENAVQKCLAYRQKVVDYFKSQGIASPVSVAEVKLQVGDDVITEGYPDEVIFSLKLKEAHVLDWKFGAEPVTETADNVQGFCYVLGVFKAYPQLESVTMHFYAPYQGWNETQQEEKYIHTFAKADCPKMELRIRTIIARKHSEYAKPIARVNLCLWCAKKGTCEANAKAIIRVSEKYPELLVPDVCAPHKLALPSQFAAAHKFASQVELWAKAVKMRCTDAALLDGIEIPGYRIVKRAERSIQSLKLVVDAAIKNGCTQEEVFGVMTIAITKVEELVKLKAPKGRGASAVRQLTSDLEEMGAVAPGRPIHFLQEIKTPAQSQPNIEV